jgi:glycosyltransferase involved in cell wall biosynthesis
MGFPLWGTEEPASRSGIESLRRKPAAIRERIRDRFLGPLNVALECLLRADAPASSLAGALLELQEYSRDIDYARSMASEETWELFLSHISYWDTGDGPLTLAEATQCMRWLQRFLAVVTVELPDVDLLHGTISGLAAVPCTLRKLSCGTPFLLTEHGLFQRELYMWLARMDSTPRCKRFLLSMYGALVRMNYFYADTVTALCEFNRRWQIELGVDPAKIRIVPNGTDPALFRPRERTSDRRPTVLTLARVFPLKGILPLIEAAAMVRKRLPLVRFLILGEVGDQAYHDQCLQLVADRELEGNVEFGQTDDPAFAYSQADLFCLPSISEGMPYCLIEAMLSGCPVVGTDVGGVAEMLGGSGVVVQPNNPQALADAILATLKDEAGRELMIRRGIERARTKYTLQQMKDNYLALYTDQSGKAPVREDGVSEGVETGDMARVHVASA